MPDLRVSAFLHGTANALGQPHGQAEAGVRENDQKLLPASAHGMVVAAHLAGEHMRHRFEHPVASNMAKAVIDPFEKIDITQNHTIRP